MCLWTGSFILAKAVFWVYEIQIFRKWLQLSTCLCGLVDRILDWYAKGPRFKTHLRLTKNSFFYRNFAFFSTFFSKWNFVRWNCHSSNKFWSLQHWVRNALGQSESNLDLTDIKWNTLYRCHLHTNTQRELWIRTFW